MCRIIFITVSALLCGVSAQAAEIRVADRDTQGLIRALQQANASTEKTTIRLARHGLYTLTQPVAGTRNTGLPVLKGPVVIDGNRAEIRRYSDADFTLLAIAETATVAISDLTLAEGSEGAILNHGKLKLRRVKVIDNVARHQSAIIENYGDIRIIDSQIGFNQLAGAERDAGTVVNYSVLHIDTSEIASNWISRRYDSLYAASAVLNFGELHLRGVQIKHNTAESGQNERALGSIVNLGKGSSAQNAVQFSDNEPPTSNQVATTVMQLTL